MAWELVGQDGHHHQLADRMVAGRAADADVVLNDPKASRRHAQFEVRPDRVIVHDLDSTNGTYVSGACLKGGARPLRPGDQIRVGGLSLTLRQTADGDPGGASRANAYPPRSANPPSYESPAGRGSDQGVVHPPGRAYGVQPGYPPPGPAYPPAYGQPYAEYANSPAVDPAGRDWLTALLLCGFLGSLGAHRFYTGHTGTGILMLLTLGFGGIWTIVDFIMIATGSFKDHDGRPMVRR